MKGENADKGNRTRNPQLKTTSMKDENADGETRTRNPLAIAESLHWHPHRILSAGTRSTCAQWKQCTSQMRSQSQMRNDKYIMM